MKIGFFFSFPKVKVGHKKTLSVPGKGYVEISSTLIDALITTKTYVAKIEELLVKCSRLYLFTIFSCGKHRFISFS